MIILYEEGETGSCNGCDFKECCPKSNGIELLTQNKGLMNCWENDGIFKVVEINQSLIEQEGK